MLRNRRVLQRWSEAQHPEDHVQVAREIFETTDRPLQVSQAHAGQAALEVVSAGWGICAAGIAEPERPRAAASFFLSHAAEDTLLARRVFEDMQTDAQADVWLDLAQPTGEVPETDAAIREWLRRSIHDAGGFVVLWTKHAAGSDWVRRELEWAVRERQGRADFHLMFLKLHDVEVPDELAAVGRVIDCDGLWWSNGMNEELYAAILGRQGRREWLASLPPDAPVSDGLTIGYEDFASDAGVVVDFRWSVDDAVAVETAKQVRWQLEYVGRDGEHRHVEGGGPDLPVDLGIERGDRVGFFRVRWRNGMHVLGPGLWMRGDDLGITSDMVLDRYDQAGG